MQCPHCDTEFAPNKELEYQYCPCCGSFVKDTGPLKLVWKGGLCGFSNRQGVMVTPYKYNDSFGVFFDGFAKVCIKGMYSYIDELGHEVFLFYYHSIQKTENNLFVVSLNGKYGMIDFKGNVIIPLVYQYIYSSTEGLTAVCQEYKYGFIDSAGTLVIPCIYEHANPFAEGLAVVQLNGKFGYIDRDGNTVIPFDYEHAIPFDNGLATVKMNEKFGCIDMHNNEVIPIIYDYLSRKKNDIIDVKYGKLRRFLNLKGDIVKVPKKAKAIMRDENCTDETISSIIKIKEFKEKHSGYFKQSHYNLCHIYPNGLYQVSLNHKYGFIDNDCNEIIPPIYDEVAEFYEGFLCVTENWKKGVIDIDNKVIIPFIYDEITHFGGVLFYVKKDGYWGVVDTLNQVIVPLKYEEVSFFDTCGLLLVVRNEKYGFVDIQGTEIIACKYDEVFDMEVFDMTGTAWVRLDKKWILIDRLGRELFEADHYSINYPYFYDE